MSLVPEANILMILLPVRADLSGMSPLPISVFMYWRLILARMSHVKLIGASLVGRVTILFPGANMNILAELRLQCKELRNLLGLLALCRYLSNRCS